MQEEQVGEENVTWHFLDFFFNLLGQSLSLDHELLLIRHQVDVEKAVNHSYFD